jgi:phosphoglycolate phosphatase
MPTSTKGERTALTSGSQQGAVKYRLVIFDMDGTLADSFPWFISVLNAVADKYRFRRVAPHEVETLRGLDSRQILEWLGVPLWKVPRIARHMRALKTQRLHEIALFPGVDRLLAALAAREIMLAIVSSDTEDNVRRVLGPHNAQRISHYACASTMFGKPRKFRAVLKRSAIPPAQTIAIGDETRDAEAARAVGAAFGAVSWGYASAAALQAHAPAVVFNSFDDIVAKLT